MATRRQCTRRRSRRPNRRAPRRRRSWPSSTRGLPGVEGEDLDRHTRAWAERVNRSGAAYLTPATLDGRWLVRVSIGAEPTEREHVESLWRLMRQEAEGV